MIICGKEVSAYQIHRGEASTYQNSTPQDSVAVIGAEDISWEKRGLRFTNFPSLDLANKGWRFTPHLDANLLDTTDIARSTVLQSLPQSYVSISSAIDSSRQYMGWYYLRFRVKSNLHKRALSLVTSMVGAYDVFIDGRHMVSYGKTALDHESEQLDSYGQYIIRSIHLTGDSTITHVIAFRYSAFRIEHLYKKLGGGLLPREFGVRAVLSYPEKVKNYYDYERSILLSGGVVAGIPLLMIFIHLFFYIADRNDRSQLYLCLYNVFSTIVGFSSILGRIHIGQSIETASIANIFFSILGTPLIASLLILVPSMFQIRYSLIRTGIQVSAILGVILLPLITRFTRTELFPLHWILIAFYVILLIEVIIVSIRVIRLRQQESTVVGIGIFFMAVGLLSSIYPILNGTIFSNRSILMYVFGYVVFYTALPVTFLIVTGLRFFHQKQELHESRQSLAITNEQLLHANQTLESRVEERTQQLSDAYEEVQRQLDLLDDQAREIEVINSALSESNAHLEEKNYELRLLNQEKNEFLGIAAHDLKNPLTGISLSVEIIAKKIERNDSTMDILPRLTDISRTVQRMQAIITGLLNTSVLDSGNLQYHFTHERLGYILHKSVSSSRDYAQSKRITLILEVPADKEIFIYVDRDKFREVMDNLISNSIKYSHPDTTVYVRGFSHDNRIRIEVVDQGVGINPEETDKLFQRFSRLSSKPTAGESSTGLGLSIVKRYVEAMQGHVWVESAGTNKGSSFIVEFPIPHNSSSI